MMDAIFFLRTRDLRYFYHPELWLVTQLGALIFPSMSWFFFLSKPFFIIIFFPCVTTFSISREQNEQNIGGLALAHWTFVCSVMDTVCWFNSWGIYQSVPKVSYTVWSKQHLGYNQKDETLIPSHRSSVSLRARELPGGGGLQDPENCLLSLQPGPFHSNTLVRFELVTSWPGAEPWPWCHTFKCNTWCMLDTWCGPANRKDPNHPKHLDTCHPGVFQQHPKALVKPCQHGGLHHPGELCACCPDL